MAGMNEEMHQSKDNHFIPMTSVDSGKGREVAPDVFYYTNQIVNVIFIGTPGQSGWVLVDTGMPTCGAEIQRVAEERFGKGAPPAAIILTHGHFDHVGGIVHLLQAWNVPVYAHPLEAPFLTGRQPYPEPDPTVAGGLLAKIAAVYPHEAITITPALNMLPADSSIPYLPGWRWIHVPGHAPGQVALFRDKDRILLSADAVITVRQDKLYQVLIQKQEVNGPPRYFTTDWAAARASAEKLAALQPAIMIAGHGEAMAGKALTDGLAALVANFDTAAIPEHGRYVPDNK